MRILALETATRRGSVALWDEGRVHARAGGDTRTHGARLPGEILTLLAEHGCAIADVDLFAIVSGPGSFTGLRVGVASIQGFALAGGRQVVPIPTLEAMAESWRLSSTPAPGTLEPGTLEPFLVVSCLDGQRGDVFFAAWEMTADTPVEQAREIIAASVGRPEELASRLNLLAARPRAPMQILVGDGPERHPEAFAEIAAHAQPVPGLLAETAVRMAARRTSSAVAPHALRPLYIRRPDAELARERADSGLSPSKGLA